jgi:XisH protein
MSARDIFHEAVKCGLVKDGWTITKDPLELEWEGVTVKIDIAADRLISADRGDEKIAIEIKSFISPSAISDFHTALGQCLNYQIMLEVHEPDRNLYLAIPIDAYENFFQTRFAQAAIARYHLSLIVYNPILEEIVKWIK